MNLHDPATPTRMPSTAGRRHGRRHSTIVVPPPAALASSKSDTDDAPATLIQHSAIGASFLILLQFFSKVVTFVLNQTLLRFLSPERLGVSTQLELLCSSILFFSREAIRLALQRQTTHPKPDIYRIEGGVVEGTVSGIAQSVVNTGYLPFLFGVPLAGLSCVWYYFRGASNEVASLPYFKSVVVIYGIASLVELVSEPMFVLAQYKLQYKLRALCESGAVAARCAVTFLLTVSAREDTGVLAFALGQLAYAVVITGMYVCLVWETTRGKENGIFPKRIWREEISRSPWFYFDRSTVRLASTLWVQTVFKNYLTEGDKLLASYFSTISEQGVYALAANYGSLIARLVFLPIEEAVRALFAKLLAPPLSAKNFRFSSDTLTSILRVYTLISILSSLFGPPIAPFLLSLVAGSRWASSSTSASAVLSAYAYYVPLLAFNGVLEAFVQSVATPFQVREQSFVMLGFSVVFAIAGYVFMRVLRLGATGLVYANMVNLGLRIAACVVWIRRYYRDMEGKVCDVTDEKRANTGRASGPWFPLVRRDAYPSGKLFGASAIAWAGVRAIGRIDCWSKFFMIAGLAGGLLTAMAWEERVLAMKAVELIVPAKKKGTSKKSE
ncbi:Rft protein-domain-containing protein [Lipomyces tetrasporus]|uniref:Man(5)GlcNAc(2)-PP-dolichol translocation protein RFT1 n=1 Tax=Lipomyces tetrasporus TaxID=54092 RepID=A0AAD7QRS2_9ASCO|nr:Rft protein-domain-containing protein [Lipomyces tetrasporus]KAJ8100324.1 Rft protein-domain-containing protein [Lipomyces tetrasporus]